MAQRTTKSQVSGYRFLLRRLEHALVRRDIRMIHDPMSGHVKSFVAGLVLTLVVVGGAVAFSIFRPQGSVGDSTIVMSKQSGQLYVIVDGRLHPALNLASARLVAGKAEKPDSVSDSVLKDYPRGSQLGIPGAPSDLSATGGPGLSIWSVCDRLDEPRDPDGAPTVGVIAGRPAPGLGARALGGSDALYVRTGDDHFVVYRGTRAQIDPDDLVVRQALGLQSVQARSVSPALLDAIPPSRAITAPRIPGAGNASRFALDGARIGSILRVSSLDTAAGQQDQLYVLLSSGIQRVSPFVADLIRAATPTSGQPITVSPGALTSIPSVSPLDVDGYPDSAPDEVDGTAQTTLCFQWRKDGDAPASTAVALEPDFPVADPKALVPAVGARSDGLGADVTSVPPGANFFVRTTGSDPGSARAASDFLVADTGVRYGVPDSAAEPLGMPTPLAAPYPIVKLIPPGPALARNSALVERSDVAPGAGS
ncbi:MAG: type VII secretion protein EccB [Gordonia paraffinivorans]